MTDAVVERLALDDGYVCPTTASTAARAASREPGMMLRAADDWNIDLAASWLIGDRWVDIGAARAAGVRSVLLETPYSWRSAGGNHAPADLDADIVVGDLTAAVDAVLSARVAVKRMPHRADGAAPQPV